MIEDVKIWYLGFYNPKIQKAKLASGAMSLLLWTYFSHLEYLLDNCLGLDSLCCWVHTCLAHYYSSYSAQ